MTTQTDTQNGRIPVSLVKPEAAAETAQTEEPSDHLPAVREDQEVETLTGRVVAAPWHREPELRPVLPSWLADPGERRDASIWLVANITHRTKYHLVRLPFYVGKLVWFAPRGSWRAGRKLTRWVFDAESAPLRKMEVESGNTDNYIKLRFIRNDAVRLRLYVVGGTAAASAVGLTVVGFVAGPDMLYAIGGAALVAAGVNGKRIDRPFIEPAILPQRARKLTPDMVFRAYLANKLCTEDDPIEFAGGPGRDSGGWLVMVELPYGKTAKEAIKKRDGLAAALRVDEVQLFLDRVRGPGGHAGLVEMWVADEDPYATLPPITPLAEMEQLDFWKPWPFGIDARRRPVEFSLLWTSFLVGSIPRMGKTFAARLPAAAAALDPHVRQIVFDGKGGRDWKALAQVAYRYGSGVRKAIVEHLVGVLRECVDDMNDRYERFQDLPDHVIPEGKLTPALSRKMKMPPVLISIDEVHRYLEDDDHGDTIGDLLTELAKVGPAAGYSLNLATQKPDSKAIPSKLRDAMGSRFALKTMTWQASEAILGTGTAKAGVNASNFLRSHKGVGYLLGADDTELADKGTQVVRTYLADGLVITGICERGRALRIEAGTLEGSAAGEDLIKETPRANLLEDVLEVFRSGEKQLWSLTICERLAEANPAAYDGWEPSLLAASLKPYGLETKQVWMRVPEDENANRKGVSRQQVLDALDDGR